MDSANTHRAWRYARHGPVDQVLQLQRLPAPAPGANDVWGLDTNLNFYQNVYFAGYTPQVSPPTGTKAESAMA